MKAWFEPPGNIAIASTDCVLCEINHELIIHVSLVEVAEVFVVDLCYQGRDEGD